MSDRGKVDAYLVGAAGLRLELHERRARKSFFEAVSGFSGSNSSPGSVPGRGDSLSISSGRSGERRIDHSLGRMWNPGNNRQVAFFYEALLEGLLES